MILKTAIPMLFSFLHLIHTSWNKNIECGKLPHTIRPLIHLVQYSYPYQAMDLQGFWQKRVFLITCYLRLPQFRLITLINSKLSKAFHWVPR